MNFGEIKQLLENRHRILTSTLTPDVQQRLKVMLTSAVIYADEEAVNSVLTEIKDKKSQLPEEYTLSDVARIVAGTYRNDVSTYVEAVRRGDDVGHRIFM